MQFRLYHVAILLVLSTLCSTIEEVSVVLQQQRDFFADEPLRLQVVDYQAILKNIEKRHISHISSEEHVGEFRASFEGR